jgi:hypothetical protein
MKRLLLFILIFILLPLIWYGESRKFFCLGNGACVTVWKTYNDVCYIVPGRYWGIMKPSKNYIQSRNSYNITIYFTSELPNSFIYQIDRKLKINNTDKDKFVFYDYFLDSNRFDSILYKPKPKSHVDLKENAELMDIYIGENYATDKNGKKL